MLVSPGESLIVRPPLFVRARPGYPAWGTGRWRRGARRARTAATGLWGARWHYSRGTPPIEEALVTEAELRELLASSKVIAVVGLSPNADRPSNQVAWYL